MSARCVFTMDTDWAEPYMIRHALDIFERHGVRATVFATHAIDRSAIGDHDIALHLKVTADNGFSTNVAELKALYPEAKGARTHGLYHDYSLIGLYKQHGLVFDSTYFMHNCAGIEPFKLGQIVWEIPVFFMDYIYLDPHGPVDKRTFMAGDLNWDHQGVIVFDFHPQHVYLNSSSLDQYFEAKPFMKDQAKVEPYRNIGKGKRGTADLLEDILSHVKANNIAVTSINSLVPNV